MKNWILVVLVLLGLVSFGNVSSRAHAQIPEGPSIDLVAMFGSTPDVVMSGVRLTSIMNVRLNSRSKIRDIYNNIYYNNGYEPNQLVCRTAWMGDDNNRLAPTVMWSVWYRPSAMVAYNQTECVDTKLKPWVTTQWYQQGYRWLGSGQEPHMGLLWLNHWTAIQPGFNPSLAPTYKWCKAAAFSYAQNLSGIAEWTDVQKKAVFDYAAASSALALVSRDVTCTSDVKIYSKWMKTPGWSFYFVNP